MSDVPQIKLRRFSRNKTEEPEPPAVTEQPSIVVTEDGSDYESDDFLSSLKRDVFKKEEKPKKKPTKK
jgi:hypothetical protein